MPLKPQLSSLFFLFCIALVFGCTNSASTPQDSKLFGIAKPIVLTEDTTRLLLSDFFTEGLKIDSIVADHAIKTSLLGNSLFLVADLNTLEKLSNIVIFAEGLPYSILVKNVARFKESTFHKKQPTIRASSYSKTELIIRSDVVKNLYAYWNNFRVEAKADGDSFRILIPPFAKYEKRSYIRVYGYTDTDFSNDILIPLNKGKVVVSTKKITSNDWQSAIIGQVNIAGFTSDDLEVSPIRALADKIFKGDYNKLGINTLWISSLNPQKNGIPQSLSSIDPKLGTAEDVKALLNAAHKNGISVILNHVANPIASTHRMFKENKNWILPTVIKSHKPYDSTVTVVDLINQEATDYVVDSMLYWLKYYDFDGISYLGSRYIPNNFFRTITTEVIKLSTDKGKLIVQFGEPKNNPLEESVCLENGMLDGQVDLTLQDAITAAFNSKREGFQALGHALRENSYWLGEHHLLLNSHSDQVDTVSAGIKAIQTAIKAVLPGIPVFDLTKGNSFKDLMELRQYNMALLYGTMEVLEASNSTFILKRSYFNTHVYLLINDHTKNWKGVGIDSKEILEEVYTVSDNNWKCTILRTK